MAQTGYSPISLYYSTTASAAPTAGNLVSGELAVNITDGVLFYKDNAGVVQTLATKAATSGTYTALTITGGTANGVGYLNGSKQFTTGSALTFDGTGLAVTGTTSATLKLNGRSSDNASSANFYDNTGATRYGFIYFDASNAQIASANANPLAFLINGSEQMRLTSIGLGIGTSSVIDANFPLELNAGASGVRGMGVNNAGGYGVYLTYDNTGRYGTPGAAIRNIANSPLYFETNNTLKATLDTSGNLGLGVTPSAWGSGGKTLQMGVYSALSDNQGGYTWLTNNAYWNGTNWIYLSGTNKAMRYEFDTAAGAFKWFTAPSGTAGTAISFTQAMTLDASGNLGLGTTSPSSRVHIQSDTPFKINNAAGSSEATFLWADSGATLRLNNYYGTGSNIAFYTNANGGGVTERARIDSSGNLLVGTTSTTLARVAVDFLSSSGNSGIKIVDSQSNNTASMIAFLNGSGTIGSITNNGNAAVLYNVTSDRRLKENIIDAPEFGSVIDAIQVRSYDWKAECNHQRAGFIAQELVTVVPEAVHQPADPEEMMAVDYSKLVPMLVKEIQSLRKRLAAAGIA